MQLSFDFPNKRICYRCKNTYPLIPEFFHRSTRNAYGFSTICRTCENLRRVGKYKETQRRYALTHRDELRAKKRAWAAANQDYLRAKNARYWKRWAANRRKQYGTVRKDERLDRKSVERAFEYWSFACAVCDRPAAIGRLLSLDHWIPVNGGGTPDATNRLPLCHGIDGCNNSKSDRDPSEWLMEKLGLTAATQKVQQIQRYFASLQSEAEDNIA